MRILYITHYSAYLGANRSLLTLVEGVMNTSGYEVMVFCPAEGEFTYELEKRRIPFRILKFKNWGYSNRSLNYWLFPLIWRRFMSQFFPGIIEEARAFSPDIIHSNSSVVSLGWQLAEVLNVRHIWHIREYGTAHYGIKFMRGEQFFYQKLQQADQLIFISDAIKDYYLKRMPGYTRAIKIYNGVFNEKDIMPTQMEAPKYFLMLGMLHPSKGQEMAVRAMELVSAKHPEIQLFLAGKGWKSYELKLNKLISQLKLSAQIYLKGYIANPAPLYSGALATLVCSKFEGMGRVTAESMAYGVPVIGLNDGATTEIISDSKGGLLFDNYRELANEMIRLLADNSLRNSLGTKGREYALDNFTNDQYISRILAVYKSI